MPKNKVLKKFLFIYLFLSSSLLISKNLKKELFVKYTENEIIIDVPVAIGMMSAGFLWPLSAWNELVSGDLLVPGDEVTVSPR